MRARYCPGHKEAPEQEYEIVQAPSSNEGMIAANVVSKQGDYTVQQDRGVCNNQAQEEEEHRQAFSQEGVLVIEQNETTLRHKQYKKYNKKVSVMDPARRE